MAVFGRGQSASVVSLRSDTAIRIVRIRQAMILVCPVRSQDKASGRIAGAPIVGVHVGLVTPLTGEFGRMRSGRNRLASRQDPGELNRLPVDCKRERVAAQRKRKLQGPVWGGHNEYSGLDRIAAAVAV